MEIFGIISLSGWLVLIIILILTYCIYMCKNYFIFKSLGIPGPTPLPVVGNFLSYFKVGLANAQREWYKKYGRVFGVFEMNNPTLYVGDPEIVKEICVKQFQNFANRPIFIKERPPLDKMAFNLKDGHWRHVRNSITPAFSSGKLKKMTDLINSACDKLVINLSKSAEKKEDVEIKESCSAFAMDVIASTAFGIQIDSQGNPDDPFVKHGKAFMKFDAISIFLLVFFPKLAPLLHYLPSTINDAAMFFQNVVEDAFRQRKQDSEERNDFLQLMVNAANEVNGDGSKLKSGATNENAEFGRKGLTSDEILAQAMGFIFAGYDTTGSTLSMVFYSLALNPAVLEKTLQEIDKVLGKADNVTYEQVGQLLYLDQVICESQRLYPAVPRVDRVCSEKTTISGVTIPKGMTVSIPVSAIHYDNTFWPDPEKFDPDRFDANVKADINTFTFMPFGQGPRNCAATRLAIMEMKMAVARVLQQLRPVKVSRTQEKPELSKIGLLSINGGAWIGMEKRE